MAKGLVEIEYNIDNFHLAPYGPTPALLIFPDLQFLRVPPGNKLEMLKGNRKGQYSIRVNDQWRICFNWGEGNAVDVEIVDCN